MNKPNLLLSIQLFLSLSVVIIFLMGCQTTQPGPSPTISPTDAVSKPDIATAEVVVSDTVPPTATAQAVSTDTPPSATSQADNQPPPIPVYTYKVINSYPHDPKAFTQGLVVEDGVFYEGTGLRGQSTLRKVVLETGEVFQKIDLDPAHFGEGITIFDNKIYQLTWQSNVGFVYDKETFELEREFNYPTEGWGLTHDGQYLILSDGSNLLYFIDPDTFEQVKQLGVYENERPIYQLNELEYIQGEIYANVWRTDYIARISPETGQVIAWIGLHRILEEIDYSEPVDVLNGIAYDAKNNRLFITGKWWPNVFEVELVEVEY